MYTYIYIYIYVCVCVHIHISDWRVQSRGLELWLPATRAKRDRSRHEHDRNPESHTFAFLASPATKQKTGNTPKSVVLFWNLRSFGCEIQHKTPVTPKPPDPKNRETLIFHPWFGKTTTKNKKKNTSISKNSHSKTACSSGFRGGL